jgi:hypothetical protein
MRHLIILAVHVITTVLRLISPGRVRAVVAESVLAKHQLVNFNRSHPISASWTGSSPDSVRFGFSRVGSRVSPIAFKPSTLLNFHRALLRKYRLLFSSKQKGKPGPQGQTADLIRAVLEMKQPIRSGEVRISPSRSNLAFGTSSNKDVVRRILARHLPAGLDPKRSLLANVYGAYEGQLVDPISRSRKDPSR